MCSALASSLDTFKSATVAAQASVLVAGQPAGTQVLSDFSGLSAAEQKRQLAGSLLEFNDGSFGLVPVSHAVVNAGTAEAKVAIKLGTTLSARQQTLEWCSANVNRLVPGILTVSGSSGALSGGLTP